MNAGPVPRRGAPSSAKRDMLGRLCDQVAYVTVEGPGGARWEGHIAALTDEPAMVIDTTEGRMVLPQTYRVTPADHREPAAMPVSQRRLTLALGQAGVRTPGQLATQVMEILRGEDT